ncbi:DUF2769 domain-containing protein [Methanolobus profundi]|uniref:DUF2769 domain-containing protein n=1 Tax=Methanolobus profundi TaxID=487685 RepID=A0A1I4U378_9EURY|nr:DUF2769 domain-containing protein [Methanolobus profundi]SFM83468.1 Protein of unknown function [Methanolobus profundi]
MAAENSCLSEGRGKYFGICTSYHHSKGCNCQKCPSYPEDGSFMFCSKGPRPDVQKKGCMCSECMIHGKFGLEGNYFCST